MDTNKILSADLLDLIFDDRNKDYGAYELRKTYQRRVIKSLIFTGFFAALTCTGVVLANKLSPKEDFRYFIHDDVIISNFIPEEKKPEPLPEPPPQQQEVPQIQTEQFSQLAIVDDDEEIDPPPTQDDLINSQIDVVDRVGVIDEGIVPLQNLDNGKDIIETAAPKEPDIWTKVEVDAKFDGNWEKFLIRNLNAQTPVDNNAPPGLYTVVIQFVVDVNGTISDVTALTKHGYGLEEEAIRVIKRSKMWNPAMQNGRQVKAYRKQPITFQVTEE